ncbi:hypothetical protein [uncultured Eubacterium sp.]|uniref:hypothetical protein n=1 Tax=uncultured Eubacterium sp. TaxID=165185 RepID=UPI00262233E2|nr:hypothetical protein [uncultured Eubacterium sp.]
MRKIDIYCPVCESKGFHKKLMEVDDEAVGIIYPYCKSCKKNIEIKVPVCRVDVDKKST